MTAVRRDTDRPGTPATAERSLREVELERSVGRLEEALRTYADPTFYFGVAFMFDRPTGGFDEDFEEVPWPDGGTAFKPGKRARAALAGGTPPDTAT